MTSRPAETEFASYYLRYVSLVPEADVLPALEAQLAEFTRALSSVTPDRETYRYAPGKWSIREVLGHMIDGERVFGYRAFCISRGESALLPSFDENKYVAESRYNERMLADLAAEFTLIRNRGRSHMCHRTAVLQRAGAVAHRGPGVLAWGPPCRVGHGWMPRTPCTM